MSSFLNNIQALRAYAAANVVYVHLLQIFGTPIICGIVPAAFGLYGVDLFFVLSGFLMARIMETDPSAFLKRRLVRIVPLYWLCTLGVYIIALLKPELLHTTQANAWNLIKSLGFLPYRKEGGVMQPMLFLGWTLNYEMYFYVICSVILLFRTAIPVLWVSLIISALPALAMVFPPKSDLIGFYSNTIVFEFILGMIAYLIFAQWQNRSKPCRWEMWLLLSCLVALPWMESVGGIRHRVMLLGLPAAGVVLASARLEIKGIVVRNRFILLVGNASYVLYLTHPYVLQVAEKFFHCGQLRSGMAKMVAALLMTGAAVAFASGLHVFVEIPLVRQLKLRFLPQKPARFLPEETTAQVASL